MQSREATGISCANIAFIKYWGNRDDRLRLPANSSISMNLAGLTSTTRVRFSPDLSADALNLNGRPIAGPGLERAASLLDRVRSLAGLAWKADVTSENNFPTGAGIASSASGFAALAVAAACAAGLDLPESELSRLARGASGSACRSVPAGFVEWQACNEDDCSYACSIAPPEHWELMDCVAVVSQAHKATVSQDGHALAGTSPLQAARLAGAEQRVATCRDAILSRDFDALAQVMELDSNLMHAVIMTSTPQVLYWQPATLAVMQAVVDWRMHGLPVAYTIDAGPNVHAICLSSFAGEVARRLGEIPGVQSVLTAAPGGPARCLSEGHR
jgi:diphosphomevalonate decarboxylase